MVFISTAGMITMNSDLFLWTKVSWACYFTNKIKSQNQPTCARYQPALEGKNDFLRDKCKEAHSRSKFPTPSARDILCSWDKSQAVRTEAIDGWYFVLTVFLPSFLWFTFLNILTGTPGLSMCTPSIKAIGVLVVEMTGWTLTMRSTWMTCSTEGL